MLTRFLSLLLLIPAVFSCRNTSLLSIAEITDSRLHRTNGFLYLDTIPFSGFLNEFYENGKLKSETFYVSGRQEGITTTWYPDGKKASERVFKNGQKEGEHKGWYQNGKLSFRAFFKNGVYEGELAEWYENGQMARLKHYTNGQEDGKQQAWRENGKLYINCVAVEGKYYGLRSSELCYSIKKHN